MFREPPRTSQEIFPEGGAVCCLPGGDKPPLLSERENSGAAGGGRQQVVVGRAQQGRVKVERERSDRTLTRACEANRWGWRTLEAADGRSGDRGA